MRVSRLLLLACLAISIPTTWAQPIDSVRVAVSNAWTMPIGEIQQGRLSNGILFDIYRDLSNDLNLPMVQVVLPRKRMNAGALAGDYDLRCYVNPTWTDTPKNYVWSKPLFEVANVVFGSAGVPEPRSIDELGPPGALVSTVLGYDYPTLQPLFLSGKLKRDDAIDEEKVLFKMSGGRTRYGLTTTASLDWYRRITPKHNLPDWRLVVARSNIHCAVPKHGNLPAQRVVTILDRLTKTGQIEAILKKYR